MIPPEVLLLLRIVLGYSGVLIFRMVLHIALSVSTESDGECMESVDCFWEDSHFY